jgi:TolB protein
MLARAYRLTDKSIVILLKSSLLLFDVTLAGLTIFWRRVALGIFALLWVLLRPLLRLLSAIILFFVNLIRQAFGRSVLSAERASSAAMARRAARAEMSASVVEDPLRRQNRVLSLLTVALLAVLVGVVLWATNPGRTSTTGTLPLTDPTSFANIALFAVTPDGAPTPGPLATPVPTATPLPPVLEARGSLAYVVRELGQTDIWAVPVGSRTPIRITNSPYDERDPAWSPDGRRLAYASRQDGNWELYIYELASGTTTRMTYDLSFQGGPSWSPDGDWLVYESYQGNNLDLYVMRVDGSQPPMRLPGSSEAPDFSPAWSPDGRRIAFVSWRDGNQDIYVFNLNDQSVVNITNTPTRHEDYPAWHPDGTLIAFSAVENGIETIFVKSADDPDSPAQPLFGGRAPSWSPDGASIIFTTDVADGAQIIASPFAGSGAVTTVLPAPRGTTGVVWTAQPLPPQLVNSGGLPPARTEPLYIEQVTERPIDPPFALNNIGVNVENAALSDRVNDSFIALRQAVLEAAGWDFLGRLDDAFWPLERPPEPGVERRNWLMTGRAFSVTRNSIIGFPPPLEVVREDLGVDTLWRLYVRVADSAQSGQLGEPLRRMPWDFASRTQGDVEAYDQGGRLRSTMPAGYYIDFTTLAEDYGWERVPAGSDWRRNSNTINFWSFRKTDGLDWYSAMREIYAPGPLVNFAPTAAPLAAAGAPGPEPAEGMDLEAPLNAPPLDEEVVEEGQNS